MLLPNRHFQLLLAQGGNQSLDPFPVPGNHNPPSSLPTRTVRGWGTQSLEEMWVGGEGRGSRKAHVSEGGRGHGTGAREQGSSARRFPHGAHPALPLPLQQQLSLTGPSPARCSTACLTDSLCLDPPPQGLISQLPTRPLRSCQLPYFYSPET